MTSWRSSAIAFSADSPRLVIWPKRILYLAYGIAALYVARRLGLPWMKATLFILPLFVVEALLQLLVSRHLPRFERALNDRVRAGRKQELLPLYASQRLLRFAAPRYVQQAKLGFIYRLLGEPRRAAAAYREALDEAPGAKAASIASGLADCLYELGDSAEAERLYRAALDGVEHPPAQSCANLARLSLQRGDRAAAEAQLRRAVEAAHGGKLRCELAQLLIGGGALDDATWQLQLAAEELASAPAGSAEREALAAAQAALEEARRAVPAADAPTESGSDAPDEKE